MVKWVSRTEGRREGNRGTCALLLLKSRLKITSILYTVVTFCTGSYEVFLKKNAKTRSAEQSELWVWRCKWCAEIHMKTRSGEAGEGDEKRSREARRNDGASPPMRPACAAFQPSRVDRSDQTCEVFATKAKCFEMGWQKLFSRLLVAFSEHHVA